jgi:hypothetical protein
VKLKEILDLLCRILENDKKKEEEGRSRKSGAGFINEIIPVSTV